MNLAVPPALAVPAQGSVLGRQPMANDRGSQALVDAPAVDAAHHLGLLFHYLRPAVLPDAVPVGHVADRDASLLGSAPLAHGGPLAEVVQFDLADGGHQAEGLHVDGVHDRFQVDVAGFHHLHQGGGGVHAPAEAVGLPADDGVEAVPPGVGQHPLELGALLGPALAHLLVADGDGQPPAFAVGFHLAGLLGDGGLVLCVLALVGDAGVDGRPVSGGLLPLHFRSWHGRLLWVSPAANKRDPPPAGSGSASSTIPPHHLFTQVAPWPGVFQHRRANLLR